MNGESQILVELDGVSCCRGDAAIANATYRLKAGSLDFLQGLNGPSLLLRIATLLEAPDEGVVKIVGEPIDQLSEADRATVRSRRFGFVFD
ncbi:MAG TPA: hypothetical protein VFG14_17565, partial [Chthoniobacteraceae bacterium]|nr:hypothetical protein [Chthoniobacteraceae bacterium]